MEKGLFSKSWFSSVISCSIFVWTAICFIGTWVVILRYDILFKGFIAVVITFLFAASIWAIPFGGLILLFLYVTSPEESPPYVMFRELIRRGMKRSSV